MLVARARGRGGGRGRIALDAVVARALAGAATAAAIALLARRARALSAGGAAAAVVVGTTCMAAGPSWGILLIAFFVATSALSRHRRREKEAHTGSIVAKGSERDHVQVLANGGLFAAAALGSLVAPSPVWSAAGAGALAAATADSWATEIGTLAGRTPRLVTTGAHVPAGTSGAVTLAGTAGSVAGALFIAILALAAGWGRGAAVGAVLGGVAGSAADTLLGATVQARRWCPRCAAPTERPVHSCGEPTRPNGGIAWLDNDAVNLASGMVGLLIGAACAG